jgi:hypothetical protein
MGIGVGIAVGVPVAVGGRVEVGVAEGPMGVGVRVGVGREASRLISNREKSYRTQFYYRHGGALFMGSVI